jgi:hypothetical protein
MLENDIEEELSLRLAQLVCEVEVPRSLRDRLARRGPLPTIGEERRQFTRFALLNKALLELTTTIKCIQREPGQFAVLATDVSRDGVAFLHVSQLFPGEVVTVWFPTGKLACRVMRCLKHNAKCFEIGAAFESGPQPQTWVRTFTAESLVPAGAR